MVLGSLPSRQASRFGNPGPLSYTDPITIVHPYVGLALESARRLNCNGDVMTTSANR